MKCTKLKTPSYRWAINDDIKWGLRVIQLRIHEWIVIIMIAYYTFVLAVSMLYIFQNVVKNGPNDLILLAWDYFSALSVWNLFTHWQGSRSMSSQGQRWMQQPKTLLTKKKLRIHASTNNEPIFPWKIMKQTW